MSGTAQGWEAPKVKVSHRHLNGDGKTEMDGESAIMDRKQRMSGCKYQAVIGVVCYQNPHWLQHMLHLVQCFDRRTVILRHQTS
jgi:hypothetical protein